MQLKTVHVSFYTASTLLDAYMDQLLIQSDFRIIYDSHVH